MRRQLFICTFFLSSIVSSNAQTLPGKVSNFIIQNRLQPLVQVDTISKKLPKNFTTKSGWHVDYYARRVINDGIQLDIFQLFYNDSIMSSSWTFLDTDTTLSFSLTLDPSDSVANRLWKYKPFIYDTLMLVKESSDFLYFSYLSPQLGDNLFIVSKKQNNRWYQFTHLIKKDFDNNIFVWQSPFFDLISNFNLIACNINTNTQKKIEFKWNPYNIADIDNINYINGKLKITAKLKIQNKNKTKKQTKTVSL